MVPKARGLMKEAPFLSVILGFALLWGIPSVALPKMAYRVGALFAVTGPASTVGDPQRKTVEMIEQWINAAGGIDGHPLDVVIYDTEGDEAKAALSLRKLTEEDGVVAAIGTSDYDIGLSLIPVIGEQEIPFISCTSSITVPLWTKGKRWVFWVKASTRGVEAIYEHMQKRGIVKIAILTPSSAFGQRGRTDLIKLAPKFGMEIVLDEKFTPEGGKTKVHVSRVKGVGAQAMINWSEGESQVEICRHWKDLRMKVPLYQGPEFGNRRMVEVAGGKADGVLCPVGRLMLMEKLPIEDPQMPALIAYTYCFRKKFGTEASPSGGHAWDALWMVVEALRVVGPDQRKIRSFLEEHIRNWPGVTGIFTMTKKDHCGLTREAFRMGVVKKGTWTLAD